MRPPNVELYTQLKGLIDDDKNKEKECGKFLKYVEEYLFAELPFKIIYRKTEYRGFLGDSDYIISAMIKCESGIECVKSYIWELKAPQCFIFKKDTNNRLIPSQDLIEAENQLINYHHEHSGDEGFRGRVKVTHPDNVCLGGIIIGSNKNLIQGENDEITKYQLYEEAYRIRNKYIYRHNNIRLIPWDSILSLFSTAHSNEEYNGESKPIAVDVKLSIY